MVFPILGAGGIGSPFGAPRDGGRRLHAGNDLFAPQLQPVVAVADGIVSRVGPDEGISGYRVAVTHDDGWTSFYIHLNNDTAGTDDGNGRGIRPGLAEGDEVVAGQVIGWVGDSGNAEGTTHHLHFELRDPDRIPVDPEASLRAAVRHKSDGAPDGTEEFDGPFADYRDLTGPLGILLSRGVPVWCDDAGALACPDDPAGSGDVSEWLRYLLGEVSLEPAADDGCEDGSCPVTSTELFRAVAWDRLRDRFERDRFDLLAGVPDASWRTPLPSPPEAPGELDLAVAVSMVLRPRNCVAPADLTAPLTRVEAAAWLVGHLGLDPFDQCPYPGFVSRPTR